MIAVANGQLGRDTANRIWKGRMSLTGKGKAPIINLGDGRAPGFIAPNRAAFGKPGEKSFNANRFQRVSSKTMPS